MSLSEYQVYPDVDNLMLELNKYDLFEHVVELEAYGITVVPPEKMQSSEGFIERLREAIIKACEKRNDMQLGDYRTAKIPEGKTLKNGWDLLEEDEVFVEAAINPVCVALVKWLLGQSAIFSGQTWIIKGEGEEGLECGGNSKILRYGQKGERCVQKTTHRAGGGGQRGRRNIQSTRG